MSATGWEAMLGSLRGGGSRAHPREQVSARGVLHAGRVLQLVRIVDVSANGAAVEASIPPRAGEAVRLEILELHGRPTLEAVVRHVGAGRAGLEFVRGGETARDAAEKLAKARPAPAAPPAWGEAAAHP